MWPQNTGQIFPQRKNLSKNVDVHSNAHFSAEMMDGGGIAVINNELNVILKSMVILKTYETKLNQFSNFSKQKFGHLLPKIFPNAESSQKPKPKFFHCFFKTETKNFSILFYLAHFLT